MTDTTITPTNVPAAPPAGAPAEPNPTPPPTPPTPPAPAPEPAPLPLEESETDAKGAVSYAPTGDAGLDMALDFVGKEGFTLDHPAMQAAVNSGDFSLLEAELARKDVKGYAAYIKLAETAYARINEKTQAKQAADKAAVEGVVGGAENWTLVSEWTKTNASEGEANVLRKMLGEGGDSAKMAASFMAMNFQKATGGIPENTDGGAGRAAALNMGAPSMQADTLDAKAYGAEVLKARNSHQGREAFEDSPAYAKLRDRRARHRG